MFEMSLQARPMWRGVPYQLHPSDAPLTLPVDMHLATEHRAVDRSEFDRAVEDKARALEVRCPRNIGVEQRLYVVLNPSVK